MKALTVCQPYAELIARGDKRVENRNWRTGHTGLIAIHAGRSKQWLHDWDFAPGGICDGLDRDRLVYGAIVAVAPLLVCLHLRVIRSDVCPPHFRWARDHRHLGGPFCWLLGEAVPLPEPIEIRGAQGLWNLTLALSADLEELHAHEMERRHR